MSELAINGLTWDHPRGFTALDAASRLPQAQALHLRWRTQPLEGFESHPLRELCDQYDLVVIDHPHIGEAVQEQCLWPLEDLFAPDELRAWAAQSVGPSYASYSWQGKQWAIPLDAATQVAAARTDLIDRSMPVTWQDVVQLSSQGGVCLSVAGPHALLSFCSMMAAHGAPAEVDPDRPYFVKESVALDVLDIMATLYGRMPKSVHTLNPIGILELMSSHDEVRYCPLVYGYVNYSLPRAGRKIVTFHDAPILAAGGRRGSTLGGTGIALSKRSKPSKALLDHLRHLMAENTQVSFIPAHEGQPSHRAAWTSPDVNAASNNFYQNTLQTMEDAYVRPRCPGYIEFQTRASAAIRAALADQTAHRQLIAELNREFTRLSH